MIQTVNGLYMYIRKKSCDTADQLYSLEIKSAFCLETSYFTNKQKPLRRQLCQWSRLAHNRFQSASISGGGIPVVGSKTV